MSSAVESSRRSAGGHRPGGPRAPASAARGPRGGVVHDYLTQMGGAERVVADFVRHWPHAEVRTLLYEPATTFKEFRSVAVHTSVLQPLAAAISHRAMFPLMPVAMRTIDVRDADLVI